MAAPAPIPNLFEELYGDGNDFENDEFVEDAQLVLRGNNIELERGEITRAGFIKLNEMEADDNEGDTDDLWITLTGMGFNKSLLIDEACPFMLKVHTQDCYDPELRVITLENSKDKINAALCDFVISKGEACKVRGMKDLMLYQYVNDHRAIMVIDNKSKSRVKVELDCSKRRNLVSHTGSLVAAVTVPGQTSVVGHNILPLDDRAEFSVICEENILK
ncbi:EF-hand calcium-binding domain-containing protein 7 [Elysia marginata]|uniref:EF-hand calcium-binding domain-containing protein 7 n=1 Tax=Elysia marginata TaxID=1093978 RepID=A0AAV4HVU8_9GAST|nr:EF-hand calcium-binding domain-containing protein 7 [Elysia marginata]